MADLTGTWRSIRRAAQAPKDRRRRTTVHYVSGGGPSEMNLKQAAAALGVHYMTAYRYVRTGRLRARRVGTEWALSPEDVRAFSTEAELSGSHLEEAPRGVDWRGRLRRALVAGDEAAAWRVLERALAANVPSTVTSAYW